MEGIQEARGVSLDMLKKYGTRWAVLAAMRLDMAGRGITIGSEIDEQLKLARVQVLSGCFSPCEVACTLSKVEGQFISIGSSLGEDYIREWSGLLAQAMQGEIDPNRIAEIPALKPVAMDCKFLACHCG
ncbi:MAG TPA: hypothetical protein VLT62_02925 [Candidatus Methylomirabilis sp.]|nr:hypothetical protein [Candidatus Methylomirabilis sp.]